jgi:hypothetical protein
MRPPCFGLAPAFFAERQIGAAEENLLPGSLHRPVPEQKDFHLSLLCGYPSFDSR